MFENSIIKFCCKNCFVVLEADPERASEVLDCPRCSTQLQVPNQSQEMLAKEMIDIARSLSTVSVNSVDQNLEELWEVTSEESWIFFASAAIISSTILLEENDNLRVWRVKGLLQQLNIVDEEVEEAVSNFVKQWLNVSDQMKVNEHVGMWLLYNLKGSEPTEDEIQKFSSPLSMFILEVSTSFKYQFGNIF